MTEVGWIQFWGRTRKGTGASWPMPGSRLQLRPSPSIQVQLLSDDFGKIPVPCYYISLQGKKQPRKCPIRRKRKPGFPVHLGAPPSRSGGRRQKERHAFLKACLFHGAEDEARTRYLHLGKVALYQMSYSRNSRNHYNRKTELVNCFFEKPAVFLYRYSEATSDSVSGGLPQAG